MSEIYCPIDSGSNGPKLPKLEYSVEQKWMGSVWFGVRIRKQGNDFAWLILLI